MPPKRKSAQPAEEVAPSRRRSTRLSLGIGAPEIATSTPVSTKNRNKKMATPKTATATPSKPAKAMGKTNETVNGKEAETQSKKRKSAPIKAVDESGEGSEPEAVEEPEEAETAGEEAQNSPEPPAKRSRTSRTQKQTSGSKTPAGEEAQAKPAKNQPKAKGTTTNGTSITETKKGGKQQSKAAESKEEVGGEQQQKAASSTTEGESEKNYWLLKAEPETRLENGVDVKFSIDDLAAKTEPEPWDGIRNYVARNNLRAMKKGDLAFFYHSNCKEPGIVGTMEIVKEHSPDLSAHDPKAPYYDAKSKPSDPKWSVVHVEFRSKFAEPIGLKELRNMGDAAGKPLANMQMLKQSRLSVSKVSKDEWEYLLGVAEGRGKVITRK